MVRNAASSKERRGGAFIITIQLNPGNGQWQGGGSVSVVNTLYIYTHYTVYFTLYTIHEHTVYTTMYTALYTVHTVHSALYTVQTAYSTLYTVRFVSSKYLHAGDTIQFRWDDLQCSGLLQRSRAGCEFTEL